MSVTVMFIVLCNVVSLDGLSVNVDGEDVKRSDDIVVNIPLPLTDGAVMAIRGRFNSNIDLLAMTVFGTNLEKEEECRIMFQPKEGILEIISKYDNVSSPYQLNKNKGIVPFEFRMVARAMGDTVDTDLIHVTFEGNRAGQHSLEIPCTFTSLINVDKILFNGAKHIRNLTFTYPGVKENR